MKFEYALKQMRDGEKIRSVSWPRESYIFMLGSMELIISQDGKRCSDFLFTIPLIQGDWELYKEPMSFENKYCNLYNLTVSLSEKACENPNKETEAVCSCCPCQARDVLRIIND